MRSHRRIVGVLLSAAVLLAGAATAWRFLPPGFPDPATADLAGLVRWTVDRELAQESPETRLVLARRLEEAFRGGVDWQAVKRRTTEAQRRRLWANLPLLLEPWLSEKAAIYAKMNCDEGRKLVDGILDAVTRWAARNASARKRSRLMRLIPRVSIQPFSTRSKSTNAAPSLRSGGGSPSCWPQCRAGSWPGRSICNNWPVQRSAPTLGIRIDQCVGGATGGRGFVPTDRRLSRLAAEPDRGRRRGLDVVAGLDVPERQALLGPLGKDRQLFPRSRHCISRREMLILDFGRLEVPDSHLDRFQHGPWHGAAPSFLPQIEESYKMP